MTTITDLIERWNTDEGKPYKGDLIDIDAYEKDPDNIGCMCAQGQVLHLIGGWSANRLCDEDQHIADIETAKLLNISRAHAVLLMLVNDDFDGAPAIVLTNPEKVLGDKWSPVLDFWWHLHRMTKDHFRATRDTTRKLEIYAPRESASAAAGSKAMIRAYSAANEVSTLEAAGATNEIQGFDVLRRQGMSLSFLPMFGFNDISEIPPRPQNYGIQKGI